MVHISGVRETEKNATFIVSEIGDCACAVLFSPYLSTTVALLLFDVIKHAVAHFAPFLIPFLLVLTILCFQDNKIC